MKTYKFLAIGKHHVNFCEDYLCTYDLSDSISINAVIDGCSSANESYFAATLIGKIIKKIAIEQQYKNWLNFNKIGSLATYLKSITKQIFDELLAIKNQLLLEQIDLLATILILIVDKKTNTAILLAVGDGLVCCDGILEEFEYENKPDYLAYHLNEDFESWYNLQTVRQFDNFQDISICTDGIFTFAKFDNEKYPAINFDIFDYLLKGKEESANLEILKKKIRHIEKEYGLAATDDLAIIRIRR
jgi:hypothetical protein